jgi:hypothetical protein
MVIRAALHGRAHVVNNFGAGYGLIYSGGIAQITEENFDIGIVHEFGGRLASNENANAVSFLQ